MKIFNKYGNWSEKVNFVDENNVLLGYNLSQSCCEQAGWFISDTRISGPDNEKSKSIHDTLHNNDETLRELPGWTFDTSFMEYDDFGYEGNAVVFRIVNGSTEKFIYLINIHNGYYSHGFDFSKDSEILKSGCI